MAMPLPGVDHLVWELHVPVWSERDATQLRLLRESLPKDPHVASVGIDRVNPRLFILFVRMRAGFDKPQNPEYHALVFQYPVSGMLTAKITAPWPSEVPKWADRGCAVRENRTGRVLPVLNLVFSATPVHIVIGRVEGNVSVPLPTFLKEYTEYKGDKDYMTAYQRMLLDEDVV